ncbi:hypothetical protein B0T16DRAFT_376308 [Cercophora newfieldiana]|uniref:Galactose oxidase n=1 Tax=Cercophora newfieldiana TaxID=92897 RepID=A0AA40CQB2_9PEZI|nr:hypothetical protein B0T16DRAFT_376308 [Cercophora newfieldiana]
MKLPLFLPLIPCAIASCIPHSDIGTWSTLAPIPLFPRQEHSTVVLPPSSFAILGGVIPAEVGANTTALVQLYDIPTNSWKSLAPLPVPLNHANAASVDGKIYLLGGLEVASDGAWRATPKSWVYDPAEDKWTEIESMPVSEARGSAAVGVYGKTIFLAGGMTVLHAVPGGQQGTVSAVSAFDTVSGKWVALPEGAKAIPEGRDHAGAAVVEGKLLVLGGRDQGQANVKSTVFALDLERLGEGWTTRKGAMPTPRGGVAAAVVGKKVFTFGGEGNPAEGSRGVFNQTEAYDTVQDKWEVLGPMKVPRHGTYAVAVDGKVYVPGGGISIGAGPVDVLDVFVPGK